MALLVFFRNRASATRCRDKVLLPPGQRRCEKGQPTFSARKLLMSMTFVKKKRLSQSKRKSRFLVAAKSATRSSE
jgi:hypothetical protein